jgi:uncharacterized integral membrane protein
VQFFYWLVLLFAFGIGILAVQNSDAPLAVIKFLIWRFEISLVHTIVGSIGAGILVTLFLWVPRAIRSSIRFRELKKRLENAETVLRGSTKPTHQENDPERS